MSRTLVIFYGVKQSSSNPLDFKGKTSTYIELCKRLVDQDYQVYVCRGYGNYLGRNEYLCEWLFLGQEFEQGAFIVSPDAVYDRSGSIMFPNPLNNNVLNKWEFKAIVCNKWLSYQMYPQLFSKSYLVGQTEDIDTIASQSELAGKIVLKPIDGLKGSLVEVFESEDISGMKQFISNNSHRKFIAQAFVDTSVGIDGIVLGTHDLRVVCLDGEIIWSHVRTPAPGQFKANVAEGGGLSELDVSLIPESVKKISIEVAGKFCERFDNPLFSIDFGISPAGPFVFEFNDTIGFPLSTMKSKDFFLDRLARRLGNFLEVT